jgi:hypothetical protein
MQTRYSKMKLSRILFLFTLVATVGANPTSQLPAAETATDQGEFSAPEQAARQKVLNSKHWQATREKFKQWLKLQTAYTPEQMAKQEADLKQHIATLPAADLIKFMEAMDERLEVLLSPDMDQARGWVDHYYTEKAQRKMAKKLNIEDPLKASGSQLQAALTRFQEQRAAAAGSSAAFNRSRQSSNKAMQSYRSKQQSTARSPKQSATYGSHYAPQKPQQRQTRYPSGWQGGWRGWGGW